MPRNITSYNMLLSCPGDVAEHIPLIKDSVENFNKNYGDNNNIVIRLKYWEEDSYPHLIRGRSGQDVLNSQLVANSDLLLSFFWTRFGSPTDQYGSGTEEEINLFLDSGKPVMLYFLDSPIKPSRIDTAQFNRIDNFKKKLQEKNNTNGVGLYKELSDMSNFKTLFCNHLTSLFDNIKPGDSWIGNENNPSPKKIILWVDDRPENNVYIREVLIAKNVEVVPALTTNQAIDWLSTHEATIIISDMGRKEGPNEGYVLLDSLRNQGNQTPFIIYATSRDPEHIKGVIKHKGNACTNSSEELLELITACFETGSVPKQEY